MFHVKHNNDICKGGEKMDVNAVITIIQNVGFPICVAIALFWKLNKDDERHRDAE